MKKKCAIFCDIDGTLIKYREFSNYKSSKAEPINSTVKEINRAFNKGHNIILTNPSGSLIVLALELAIKGNFPTL